MARDTPTTAAFREEGREPRCVVTHSRSSPGQDGYNLVILVVAVTVLNIMVAVAMPLWSRALQREREEEAIFRGLQYAEAIRVFRLRFGRYPNAPEELLEVEPRSIRRMWKDPLTRDGGFGLVIGVPQVQGNQLPGGRGGVSTAGGDTPSAEAGGGAIGPASETGAGRFGVGGSGGRQQPGEGKRVSLVKVPPPPDDGDRRRRRRGVLPGPVHGVYVHLREESMKSFLGKKRYEEWVFTPDLIRLPGGVDQAKNLPRLTSAWIGRPFPPGLSPRFPGLQEGSAPDRPGGAAQPTELRGGGGSQDRSGMGGRQRQTRERELSLGDRE